MFSTPGVAAFSSVEPIELERTRTGLYSSVVKVPSHLLSESEYSVNVSAFASAGSKKHYVSVRNAINFQIYDSMTNPSARGDYTQNLAGVVRPMLHWETYTKQIDS